MNFFFLKKIGFLSIVVTAIIAAAVLVMAACSSPVGAIDSGSGSGSLDGDDAALWAVPNRIIYNLSGDVSNYTFSRSKDFQLFYSDSGAIKIIPTSSTSVEIYVVEKPGQDSSKKPVNNGSYSFAAVGTTGRKEIEITYKKITTYYSVEVQGKDITGGENGNGGSSGGGTFIEWVPSPSVQVILTKASGSSTTINPGRDTVYSDSDSAMLKARLFGLGGAIITRDVTWSKVSGDFEFDSPTAPDTVVCSSASPVKISFTASDTDAVVEVSRNDDTSKKARVTIKYRPTP